MACFRKLIVAFLVLWLPLSPVLGIAMPFCQQSLGIATHDVPQGGGHEHAAQPPEHGDVFDKAGKYHCASFTLCHLASASAITSCSEVLSVDLKADHHPFRVLNFTQFVPERPERPPRLMLA